MAEICTIVIIFNKELDEEEAIDKKDNYITTLLGGKALIP